MTPRTVAYPQDSGRQGVVMALPPFTLGTFINGDDSRMTVVTGRYANLMTMASWAGWRAM